MPCAALLRVMITALSEPVHYPATPQSRDGAHPPGAPTPEEVRRQVQRIIASQDFGASPRNRRFLEHVVGRTLRGETACGYEIGTLVFGRPKSFNATSDPIVRIEAGKLRRDLETYYLKSGRHDPIRILLPKGAYRAVFVRSEAHAARPDPSPDGLLILHAALFGLAGEPHEAAAAWRAVQREGRDFAMNPQPGPALEAWCAGDGRIRELLLGGLQRAAQSAGIVAVECGAAHQQTA